ncbi:MAG: hypothetical protein IKU98_03790 [Bacteroidaceae bacterium]|nr:hypothetical protein [Bacteroidaceae bacterium]
MKIKKFLACALAALAIPTATWAQEENEENGVYVEMEANVVSSYVWHGQYLGGLSVQPSLTIGWNDLSLNVWGSAGIGDESHREIDLSLGYELGNFSLGLTDYWFLESGQMENFLNYAAHSTVHTLEASIGYDLGFMSLGWSTYWGGSDYDEEDNRQFTSYIQANVPFTLGGFEGEATVGATPWGSELYGANRFMVCETSVALSKELKLTPTFSMNTTGKFVLNPATGHTFFVLGLGF